MSTSAKAGKATRSTDTATTTHDGPGGRGASMASPPSGMQFVDRTATAPGQGLPAALRDGIESLSGLSLEHVRVHYNSPQPANLGARAYAQGSDIHLAPGQEHALPHEAWHVVQQAQGRVRPTLKAESGPAVNDQRHLEREADAMGARALSTHPQTASAAVPAASAPARSGLSAAPPSTTSTDAVIQGWPGFIDRFLQKRKGYGKAPDPDMDLAEESRFVGRQAESTQETVESQRRDQFAKGAVQVGKETAKLGLDALGTATIGVPIGSIGGGALSAHGVASSGKKAYRKTGKGKSAAKAVGKEVLKEGVGEAVGNIPVVGEFIGIAEGVGKMAYAFLQSDDSRHDQKQQAMDKLIAQASVIEQARERLAQGGLEAVAERRLQKAVDRYDRAMQAGIKWQKNKADKGKQRLLETDFED
jgi:hypothetical protein